MPEVISTEEKDAGGMEHITIFDTESEVDEIKETVSWEKVVS